MRTAKTLIRLGRCPGWSESLLGAHSLRWFCHVAVQLTEVLWFNANSLNPDQIPNSRADLSVSTLSSRAPIVIHWLNCLYNISVMWSQSELDETKGTWWWQTLEAMENKVHVLSSPSRFGLGCQVWKVKYITLFPQHIMHHAVICNHCPPLPPPPPPTHIYGIGWEKAGLMWWPITFWSSPLRCGGSAGVITSCQNSGLECWLTWKVF